MVMICVARAEGPRHGELPMNVANGALASGQSTLHAFQFERGQIENGVARPLPALGDCAMFHNMASSLPGSGQTRRPAPDH